MNFLTKATPEEILEDNILKVLLKLSIPIMIAFGFHTAFNFVDRFFVSRIGGIQLGALGMAFTVQIILIGLGAGTGVGSTSLIARLIGARKLKDATNAAEHALFIIICFSLPTTIICPLLTSSIFSLLGASATMKPYILTYINIILYGSFFQFFTMIGNAILRGEGNMITPMRIMIIATIVNIILDPILIFGLGPIPALGVKGAAIATVSGRVVGSIFLSFSLFRKKNIVKPELKNFNFKWKFIGGIFGVGGPAIISRLAYSLGLSLLYFLLKPYGDIVKAAFTMGFTYQQLAFLPILGIASGVITMVGQNFGAKKFARIKLIKYRALLSAMAILTGFALFFIFFRTPLVNVFGRSADFISVGKVLLFILALAYPFMAARIIFVSFFQGLGMGFKSLLLDLIQMIFLTIPLAFYLSIIIGLNGIWIGVSLANLITAVIGFLWLSYTLTKIRAYKVP